MNIKDIKQAREEAKKFIEFVDDMMAAEKEKAYWFTPAESGLVSAQSIILSRALSAMRNPWTCRRSKTYKDNHRTTTT